MNEVTPAENTAPVVESTAHLMNEEKGDIIFLVMPTDFDEEYANMLAQCLNWQNQTIAVTHRMVLEMHETFAKLKPLVDSIPTLPAGLTMPGMPGMPSFPGMPRKR